MTHLGLVTVVVRDYDEAITFYRDIVGFALLEDTRIDENKRCPGRAETQSPDRSRKPTRLRFALGGMACGSA